MGRMRDLLTRPFRLRVGGVLVLVAVAAIALEPKARAWRSPAHDEILDWMTRRLESLPTTPREKRKAAYPKLAAEHLRSAEISRVWAEDVKGSGTITLYGHMYGDKRTYSRDELERDARAREAFHRREAARCAPKADDNSPIPREDADWLVTEYEAIDKERERLLALIQDRRLRLAEERAAARKHGRLWSPGTW